MERTHDSSEEQTNSGQNASKESIITILFAVLSFPPTALLLLSLAGLIVCLILDAVFLLLSGEAATPIGTYRFFRLIGQILRAL